MRNIDFEIKRNHIASVLVQKLKITGFEHIIDSFCLKENKLCLYWRIVFQKFYRDRLKDNPFSILEDLRENTKNVVFFIAWLFSYMSSGKIIRCIIFKQLLFMHQEELMNYADIINDIDCLNQKSINKEEKEFCNKETLNMLSIHKLFAEIISTGVEEIKCYFHTFCELVILFYKDSPKIICMKKISMMWHVTFTWPKPTVVNIWAVFLEDIFSSKDQKVKQR